MPEEGINKGLNFSIPPCGLAESLECLFDQMKTMPRKDRVSTLSDVTERALELVPMEYRPRIAHRALLDHQALDLRPSGSRGMFNSECFQLSLTSAAVPRRPQRTSIDVATIAIVTVRIPTATRLSGHG